MTAPQTQLRITAELAPDFEILRLLGEGSMAHVYLAREVALQRLVAVKVLKPAVAHDETARKRFDREARSVAKISHRNVTAVYRVGALENETPYIVMEHVEGRNLRDTLEAGGPLDVDTTCSVLSQLASALAAVHSVGVIHRDVRPGNVLREKDSGRVVLTDFGIAGLLDSGGSDATRLTQAGQLLGDPRYMSPEQLLGEPVTDQTDIYSLGILGHELLTLHGPYDARSKVEMATAHLRQDPRPITDFRSDADPRLSDLLLRCLAKKPEHRPHAMDVVKTLERITDGEPASPEGHVVTAGQHSSAGVPFPALRGFLDELKRRKVYKVAVAYATVTLILLGGAELTFDTLPLPEAAYKVLVALTLGAFPIVLTLAWVFDITSHGIERTKPTDQGRRDWKLRALQATGLGLSLVAAIVIGRWILGS